jgi:hypothetical protein
MRRPKGNAHCAKKTKAATVIRFIFWMAVIDRTFAMCSLRVIEAVDEQLRQAVIGWRIASWW